MDAFKDLWANFSTCLIDYQNHLVAGAALMAIVGRVSMEVKSLCNWVRPSEEKDAPPTNNSEININNNGDGNAAGRDIKVTYYHSNPSNLDRYIQSIERQLSGFQDRLERANADKGALSSENRILLDQINDLKSKLANAATELEQAKKRVADTEQRLAANSNTIDPEQLEQARRMLRDFDFDGAEKIFRGIVGASEQAIRQSASAEFGLGQIAEERVNWNAAYQHYKRANDFDNDNPQYAQAYAIIATRMGRYPEAVQIFETALQQVKDSGKKGTEDHAKALNNLAIPYFAQKNFALAEPMYERALSIFRGVLGNDHPDTAMSLNNLANLYSDQVRYAEAKPLLKDAAEILELTLRLAHPNTKRVRENYEKLLAKMKEQGAAGAK